MKPITLYLALTFTTLLTLNTLTTAHAQTLDAFFSPTDLAHLDQFITAAQKTILKSSKPPLRLTP